MLLSSPLWKQIITQDEVLDYLNLSLHALFRHIMNSLDTSFYLYNVSNLSISDTRQEGWRLEPEDLSNPDSPMIFKGVVFNEMKGAMVSLRGEK